MTDKVLIDRALLQQALKTLKQWSNLIEYQYTSTKEGMTDFQLADDAGQEAIKALTEALAAPQPAQTSEPVNPRLLSALAGLLEQVEKFTDANGEADFETTEALAAVEAGVAAEAQPAQPVANVPAFTRIAESKLAQLQSDGYKINGYHVQRQQDDDWKHGAVTAQGKVLWWQEDQIAQPAEPVATVQCINGVTIGYLDVMQPVGTKLYTTPQPQRQPLTTQQINSMWADAVDRSNPTAGTAHLLLARAVEQLTLTERGDGGFGSTNK